jgi:ribosomal protein L11 methylase PrmA
MRDPLGKISFEGEFVIREIYSSITDTHFLKSPLAKRWVEQGLLIPYEFIDSNTIRSPRLPFLTLPSEWTSQQFYAAAQFTLQLQTEAVAEGWDLKDASAWNIVFNGLNPVFVDLLSFIPLESKLWRAAGQFSRHFLLPLLLGKKNRLQPQQCMQLWRDGVPPKSARELLGFDRFFTRYWPLMTGGESQSSATQTHTITTTATELDTVKVFRTHLQSTLKWMLDGVCPKGQKAHSTVWGQYEQERTHYSETLLAFKRQIIGQWLDNIKPAWVLDLGCNAGEFSELAINTGAKSICWDADHQALNTLFLRHSQENTASHYFPILCPIDDLSSGRGWMGKEFPSLMHRLHQSCDVVMLLAITHHLAIAAGVRLDDIFLFVAHISRRAVFLELLSEKDIRVVELCNHFNRDPSEFTIEKQLLAAMAAGFQSVQRAHQDFDDTREFVWMEHKPAI